MKRKEDATLGHGIYKKRLLWPVSATDVTDISWNYLELGLFSVPVMWPDNDYYPAKFMIVVYKL